MASQSRVGDVAWEVDWCSEIPVNEFGDGDHDGAVRHVRRFKSRDAAMKYAAEVYPKDAYGSVIVTQQRFEPYDERDAKRYPWVGFWDCVGDSEYYEGGE